MKKKVICPTSLSEYIKDLAGNLHGHQIKGIADFVFAIIEQRTAVQAGLAEVFGNQEAAGKRLARLLRNPRISPKELSEMVFEQTLKQLSKVGKIRLAFDWTIENKQYLLVISLVRNGRAIPIFWRGYEESRLKGKMKLIERAMRGAGIETVKNKGRKKANHLDRRSRICGSRNLQSLEKRENSFCHTSQMQHFDVAQRSVEKSQKY